MMGNPDVTRSQKSGCGKFGDDRLLSQDKVPRSPFVDQFQVDDASGMTALSGT